MPLFTEFGAAAQGGDGKQKPLFDQERGKGCESGCHTTAKPTVAGQKGGQRTGVNEVLSRGEEERNRCPVLGRINNFFDRKQGRTERNVLLFPNGFLLSALVMTLN